jgi:carbonic anhydrase/acetyltransferase-like protein (isoleucine patch superfamily)
VTDDAEASTPSLGFVAKVTSSDNDAANATRQVADSVALASGYAMLYQGNSATGGAASAGPVPSAVAATGSTIYFGALNAVLGVSSEPGSTRGVAFEPSTGTTPTFQTSTGTPATIAPNLSYAYPARIIGNVAVTGQTSAQFSSAQGGISKIGLYQGPTLTINGDTIRADEGQPITIESISSLGKNVVIDSPLGGVEGTTSTTVLTSTTKTATGVTTTTSTTTTAITPGAPTATDGTTTTTTTGINANGQATTGTVTTTIATKTTEIGAVTIGRSFTAGADAVILGSPTSTTSFGDGVTVGADAVVSGSTIGSGAVIGNKAYIANSTIPAGAVIPNGAIIINDQIVGTVEW